MKTLNPLIKLFFALILLALLCAPALAILQSGNVKIFAVTEDNKGMAADLYISVIPGSGKVAFITSSSLVGKDTQTTGNIALQIAQKKTNIKLTDKDLIFDIRANASEVDGPSAGAAMTLLTYSMLAEKPLNPAVAITGTINNDGSVGMVGGVGAKAQAASKVGIKLFMIPSGEAVTEVEEDGSYETVNLIEYGQRKLGMKIVEISTFDQAVEYAYTDIDSIKIDANVSTNMFIPKSITYDPVLAPMKKISQNYVSEAKAVVDQAKTDLEKSDIPDDLRADMYQRLSSTKRSIEMAQRFLDQNYLYSAANYAFNARVMAGAIGEVANNPSLLTKDTTILDSKISELNKEIDSVRESFGFVPLDDFEWVVGAEQRVGYAENALNKIQSTAIVTVDVPTGATENEKKNAERQMMFDKVYDFVSAKAWTSVAKDFLRQAQLSGSKKIPYYTPEFVKTVSKKISTVDQLITDANASPSILEDSKRRLATAKISFDHNFLIAAFYDAVFAEAFILSEKDRANISADDLYIEVEKDINKGSNSDSIWANMFFDHAKFYYENALFNKKNNVPSQVEQSIQTGYDLISLSKRLNSAKAQIAEYLAFTPMQDYKETQPVVDIKYTKREDPLQYAIALILILVILLISVVLLLGLASRARNVQSEPRLGYDSRREKLGTVLGNLDRALTQKKISDAEYFFMKKKYEDELQKKPSVKEDRKKLNLSLEDLRAKQRALERGAVDLKRHYKAGLIIPEDYEKNFRQVTNEIEDIKAEIRQLQGELRLQRREASPIAIISKKLSSSAKEPAIKGTEELVEEEKKQEAQEKSKRRKVLKKFAFKEKPKSKRVKVEDIKI
jgi:uncharacterized protein